MKSEASTLALLLATTLFATSSFAQDGSPEECTGNDAVDGVNWDIVQAANGRVFVTGDAGVYYSCDDGETWSRPTTNHGSALSVLPLPGDLPEVLLGDISRIYRSTDSGVTFSYVPGTEIQAWSMSATKSGVVFIGADDGIYRSDDRGRTGGLIEGSPAGHNIRAMTVDYSNENVIFAGSNGGGFFRSTDGGLSWDAQSNGNSKWQINEIAQDPNNPSVLYAGAWDGIWQSSDAGTSWVNVGSSRIMDITFDPSDSTRAYAVSFDRGIVRSIDGGNTWQIMGSVADVPNNKIYSIAALESGRLIAGTEFLGAYLSDDQGRTWTRSGATPSDDSSSGGNTGGGSSSGGSTGGSSTTGGSANVTASIQYTGKGTSIAAGKNGKFKVTIRNTGNGASDSINVSFAWFQSPLFGQNQHMPYTLSTTQGQCSRSVTPEPDCRLGSIPAGGQVVITFSGETRKNELDWFTLRAFVGPGQSLAKAAEYSIGTKVTVVSSDSGGGGSTDLFVVTLLIAVLFRRYRKTLSTNSM